MRQLAGLGRLSLQNSAGRAGLGLRAWVALFLFVALSTVTVDSAMAQSAPPPGVGVSFTSDRSDLTVGDVATLSLLVSHRADLAVVIPRLEREWGPFEVQDQTSVQTVSADGGMRTIAKQFRVVLFAPGAFETPSLPISVRSPNGSVERFQPTPVRLTVHSVLTGTDERLKDLRQPADLSTPFWEQPAFFVLAALVVVAALGVPGYYLYRRSRRQVRVAEPVVDTRSPWEAAIQELDRIGRLDLPGKGDSKGHYTLVAGALRAYLGATYLRDTDRMQATDMSTEEMVTSIWRSPLDHGNARLVIELLQEADLVKFANYAPPASRAYEAAGQVRELVETTRLSLERTPPVVASGGAA